MRLLQVLGEKFRSVASRRGTSDANMLRAFCLPECNLAPDNVTYSVKFLRGATGEIESCVFDDCKQSYGHCNLCRVRRYACT